MDTADFVSRWDREGMGKRIQQRYSDATYFFFSHGQSNSSTLSLTPEDNATVEALTVQPRG